MKTLINISPEEGEGSSPPPPPPGGGEDVVGLGRLIRRTQGYLVLAFGLAFGTALLLLSLLVTNLGIIGPVTGALMVNPPTLSNFALVFLAGFVGGIVISMVYNMLVVNRLNLFGLESNVD